MGPMSCRERNMMNIMSYVVTQKSSMSASLAILDKSQSIDRTQFRDDGVVPTVCTTSSLWAFALGRELKAAEIACLFGHKATPFGGQTEAGLKFLLGNSMHLAEARVCVCVCLLFFMYLQAFAQLLHRWARCCLPSLFFAWA